MVIQTRKVYICEHCKKKYFVKGVCAKHELKCNQRPGKDNICWECEYLHTDVIEYEKDSGIVVENKVYLCLAKEVVLKVSSLGDKEAIRMPNMSCSDYKRKADKRLKV